jgi:beta-galactosidase
LWGGKPDPHLYTVTLEIYKNNELYHRYERPYGLRYYSYVIDQVVNGQSYTGFLLNGLPYQLRGVCMHDDLVNKANALNDTDYAQEFAIIQELGCNFIRLAHYPHPKEVYDWCDRLGIIVQTEVPCVNKLQSTLPEDYYDHLEIQYRDMVEQHFNHPCIMFWGLSNETSTDNKDFGKQKIEEYTTLIKSIDTERMVGYVMSHSYSNPSSYYNNPAVDWFGCNIYVGWYIDKAKNDPTAQLNNRITNIVTNLHKPVAFSEYGCGGTQHCHSDDFKNTTTTGNYGRHDIEYMMWLHEGHVTAIRNFPQLMFTAQWQLFDIAVSSRNEGYTECLDGTTTSTNDELRRLNNKGLVERDHVTKKDPFYLYKAEWNPTPFVHICCKDYTKITDRVLKCYTNDGNSLSLYDGNNNLIETVQVTDHIALFTSRNFTSGVTYKVQGSTTYDTVTF